VLSYVGVVSTTYEGMHSAVSSVSFSGICTNYACDWVLQLGLFGASYLLFLSEKLDTNRNNSASYWSKIVAFFTK